MPNFHSTNMGKVFYEVHIPKMIRSLEEIALETRLSNRLKQKELELKERELELKHRELVTKNRP